MSDPVSEPNSEGRIVMSKRFVPFVALAVAFTPAALADTTEVSVDIVYDAELLNEESTAIEVMNSVKAQARDACSFTTSISYTETVDAECVEDVVTKAVNAIVAERHAEGLDTADVFANRATITLAALDQG